MNIIFLKAKKLHVNIGFMQPRCLGSTRDSASDSCGCPGDWTVRAKTSSFARRNVPVPLRIRTVAPRRANVPIGTAKVNLFAWSFRWKTVMYHMETWIH